MEKINSFKELLKVKPENGDYEKWFSEIAKLMFLNYCINSGGNKIGIVEIEFYFKDDQHVDPYIHGRDQQMTNGKWYFNDFGLDLTFGKEKDYHGGILIRGICEKDYKGDNEFTFGPSKILRKIFDNMKDAFNPGFHLEMDSNRIDSNTIYLIQTKRINLPKKENDNGFGEKLYRYVLYRQELNHPKLPKKDLIDKSIKSYLLGQPVNEKEIKITKLN